jgi:hypothetical protein
MVQQQDSTDPTGVAAPKRNSESQGNAAGRARARKANAALQMRYAGATWTEIAQGLGYPTPRTAMVATERALERELANADDRDKMRKLAGARLERLVRAVWPKAINPDDPDQMIAVGKAREVLADHRKLFGLDAPTEVVVHNPTETELAAWVARVVAVNIPAVEEYDIIAGEIEGPDALSS